MAEVQGWPFDFRSPRQIGAQDIDYTSTDLARGSDGLAWVHLSALERGALSLWVDGGYPYLEIYTAHTQPAPHWRTGLGVEPMTCPPNAFRTGQDLIRLQPGQSHSASWGLTRRE